MSTITITNELAAACKYNYNLNPWATEFVPQKQKLYTGPLIVHSAPHRAARTVPLDSMPFITIPPTASAAMRCNPTNSVLKSSKPSHARRKISGRACKQHSQRMQIRQSQSAQQPSQQITRQSRLLWAATGFWPVDVNLANSTCSRLKALLPTLPGPTPEELSHWSKPPPQLPTDWVPVYPPLEADAAYIVPNLHQLPKEILSYTAPPQFQMDMTLSRLRRQTLDHKEVIRYREAWNRICAERATLLSKEYEMDTDWARPLFNGYTEESFAYEYPHMPIESLRHFQKMVRMPIPGPRKGV